MFFRILGFRTDASENLAQTSASECRSHKGLKRRSAHLEGILDFLTR
jgi:hypothetical protein